MAGIVGVLFRKTTGYNAREAAIIIPVLDVSEQDDWGGIICTLQSNLHSGVD